MVRMVHRNVFCNRDSNDCDGNIDEGLESIVSFCGLGVCRVEGITACQNGTEMSECLPGSPTGNDQNCDGLDDDCDGQLDEGCQ